LVPSGRCQAHAPADRYAKASYAATHKWYGLERWQQLRAHVLREQPFCMVCRAQGQRIVATDVDHVVKHDGEAARFWDVRNLQALCRSCHSEKTRRGE